jgi:hypothetical protein
LRIKRPTLQQVIAGSECFECSGTLEVAASKTVEKTQTRWLCGLKAVITFLCLLVVAAD